MCILALAATFSFAQANAPENASRQQREEISAKLPKGVKEGTVVVRCVINQAGKVTDAKIHRSLNPDADAKALAAVKRWKFQPATKDGKPVMVQADVTVTVKNSEP